MDISPLTQYPVNCDSCGQFTSTPAADILSSLKQACRHCNEDITITPELKRAVKRTLTSLQCCYNDSRNKDFRDSLDDQESAKA